jgi:hypothetical protein
MRVAFLRAFAVLPLMACALAAQQTVPLGVVDEPIPPLEANLDFHVFLHATGGVPPYLWLVASGDLPDGITLSPEGLLAGHPTKTGAFSCVLTVKDSGQPSHTINKKLKLSVEASLLLRWLREPKVTDDRIDGSLQVSNSSKETFDLTVVVVAIAENGRATAIGYEHFPLKPGTTNQEIPFGNTLPHGGYSIRADAIAEIPKRNVILRQGLETPKSLQVIQGP